RRALAAPVARIRAIDGEGDTVVGAQRFGGTLDEQGNFPVPGMVAQSQRRAVFSAQAALRAHDAIVVAADFLWMPAHRHVLRHAKQISAWFFEQRGFGERQPSARTLAKQACLPRSGFVAKYVVYGGHQTTLTVLTSVSTSPMVMLTLSPACSVKSLGGTIPVPVSRTTPSGPVRLCPR